MTNPVQLGPRVDALEAAVTQLRTAVGTLQTSFSTAVQRLTGVEELATAGGARLAALEAAARGFASRIDAVEAGLRDGQGVLTEMAARLTALEELVGQLQTTVGTLGQVARPGRTVMRQRLEDLQGTVNTILERLPPPPTGGTAR